MPQAIADELYITLDVLDGVVQLKLAVLMDALCAIQLRASNECW